MRTRDMKEETDQNTVCAVIVTHNRLELLQRCIVAIRAQSYPISEIIVVCNGCTDGTVEWLRASKQKFSIIEQGNLGSAGGQAAGMRRAVECGYEWIWSMDDDGAAHPKCLQHLITVGRVGAHYVAPVVIDGDQNLFAGQFFYDQATVSSDIGGPFNGILLNRGLLLKVGFPRPAFFIWGDEFEFADRVRSARSVTALVRNAHYYHHRGQEPGLDSRFLYIFVRNTFWRFRAYRWNGLSLADYITINFRLLANAVRVTSKYCFLSIVRLNLKAFVATVRGAVLGLVGQYD